MSRLIASDSALRALVLLSQRASGLRTSELANALEISHSGAEKALGILLADGLAEVSQHRYGLSDSSRAREAVRFALAFLPLDTALAGLARGNESVEFAAVDDGGAIMVLRRFSETADEGRVRAALETLARVNPEARVEVIRKEDLRRQLHADPAQRRRAGDMRILAGTLDRTFPDRTRHGDDDASPLGRLSDGVSGLSARRMAAFARKYGLRRVVAFGSATRSDFRPDSDLDLLVEPMAGRHLDLHQRIELAAEAERLFGRDVDLLTAPVRRATLADRISRDGVVLYDATR
jgi:predicted nucleotidyltransferase